MLDSTLNSGFTAFANLRGICSPSSRTDRVKHRSRQESTIVQMRGESPSEFNEVLV
jgi:hypothetical protein